MTREIPAPDERLIDERLITEPRAEAIYRRILGLQRGGGRVYVTIDAWWRGELSWARNRVNLACDRRDLRVFIRRQTDRGIGMVHINQVDDAALEMAVRAAERDAKTSGWFMATPTMVEGVQVRPPLLPYPETAIWSDATYGVTAAQRIRIADRLSTQAETDGMLSAGFLEMRAMEEYQFGYEHVRGDDLIAEGDTAKPVGRGADRKARVRGYVRHTQAQCSVTVRHPKGMGSGWAGLSGYDWAVMDGDAIAARSLDKCLRSLNPVAIEPGRYTAILEPQAVAQLITPLVAWLNARRAPEDIQQPRGPFAGDLDPAANVRRTKLGTKILDDRITIHHDPMHPMLGVVPSPGLVPTTWVDRGVLRTLSYTRAKEQNDYAIPLLNDNIPELPRPSCLMSGGTTTIDEMVVTTKRGVLVTRFHQLIGLDMASVLCTGVTRDGLWLIENGKISKAIKNMWITDSPLFALNQLEQLGVPVPIFNPNTNELRPMIVPPVKCRDFAFTATVDAV